MLDSTQVVAAQPFTTAQVNEGNASPVRQVLALAKFDALPGKLDCPIGEPAAGHDGCGLTQGQCQRKRVRNRPCMVDKLLTVRKCLVQLPDVGIHEAEPCVRSGLEFGAELRRVRQMPFEVVVLQHEFEQATRALVLTHVIDESTEQAIGKHQFVAVAALLRERCHSLIGDDGLR